MSSIELWVASGLVDVSIKAALLALAAWVGMAACRVRSSTIRHRVWFLVLVGMLLLPALVNVLPGVSLPGWLYPKLPSAIATATDDRTPSSTIQQPAAGVPTMPDAPGPASASPPSEPEPAAPTRDRARDTIAGQERGADAAATVPLPALAAHQATPVASKGAGAIGFALAVAVVYLAGVALLTLRLLIGMIQAWRLVRRAKQVDLPSSAGRLPARARIMESAEVLVPVTIGCRRPAVVLPADWKTWSDAWLAMVLAHETEHVRRGDTWVALLAAWNCAVYWFHPVAWLVRRRLAVLAEQVCDDAVIRATGSRNEYAQNLLDMAGRLTAASGRLGPAGVAMARTANVVNRIEAILDNDRPLSRKIGAAAALLLACIVAPLVFLAAGLRPAAPTVAAERAAAAAESSKTTEAKPLAAGLKGRVLMADDGKPVAGAEVRLLIWKHGYDTKTATANAEGQFEFKGLAEGKYTLAAYYQNLSSRGKRYQGYEVKAGEDSIVLKLHAAPSLKVKVVARADGKPIQGATVELVWTDAKPADHLTDASGEVLFNGLTPEDWTIKTRAKGFAVDKQAVNLSGTETASVTAKLAPGVELFGVVRDADGKGLPAVAISVNASDSYEHIDHMKTDVNGKYRFEYVPITGLTLFLSKEGYVDFRPEAAITAPPGGRQELNLTLPRRPDGGSVRGTVVDKDGKPIEGASIVNRGGSSSDERKATTDAQGRFRLDDVFTKWGSVGGHELFVTAKHFAPQQLEFKPGDREHPAELNVTLAAGHRIRGRVVDEQGQPLADVSVYYADSDHGGELGGNATTDAEGRFEFDSLPAGSPLTLVKDGYSEMENATLPLDGPKEVLVTMRAAGVIRGRVVDGRTGKPLSPFMVHVTFSPDREPDDPSASLSGARAIGGEKFATPDGTFRLNEFVRDMPLQVTVEADGYDRVVVRRVVALADSEAKPVEFRLAPIDASSLLVVAGRLVDEQARPRAGAQLRLIVAAKRPFPRDRFPFNWEMIRSGQVESTDLVLQFLKATTDRDGRFHFTQIRAGGDIELAYWGEGVSQDRREHIERLSPKEQADLTIVSKTPGSVRGAIDRRAYPELGDILLSGYDQFRDAKVSPENDSYEIRNVPAGRYQLQVYGPARPSGGGGGSLTSDVVKRIPIELKSGETLTVDLGPDSNDASPAAKGGEKAPPEKPRSPGPPSKEGAPAQGAPAVDKGSEIVIAGAVKDESGGAIGGARLWLPLNYDDDKRLVEATTTAAGAFTLRVPAAWTEPEALTGTIWCYAKDHQIAAVSAYQQLKRRSQSPIEFVLKPKADTGFIVKDAGGAPVAGARVEPFHFFANGSYDIIPGQLREVLAQETDAGGRVFFPEMGRDGFFNVQVTAEGYGVQQLRLQDRATEPAIRTITLRPTGRLEGRMVCDDKAAIKSAHVYVYQEDFLGEHTSGIASPEVSADGRFVVPAFAEGPIKLIIRVDQSLAIRPRIPERLEIYAGKTTDVAVPFERTVRARGRVETKGDGAPVAGATVHVYYGSFRQGETVLTDADGRFVVNVLAGKVRRQLIMHSGKYADWIVAEADWDTAIKVPAGAATFDLPPLVLVATVERAGRLVDRSNRPVAEAEVCAVIGNRRCAFGKSDASAGSAATGREHRSSDFSALLTRV